MKNITLHAVSFLGPLLLIASMQSVAAQPVHPAANALAVSWEPDVILNGAPCLFSVKPQVRLLSLGGAWFGKRVFFDPDAAGVWHGLAGVSVDATSGTYQLALEAVTADGQKIAFKQPVFVGRFGYRSIALRVDTKFTDPSPDELAVIKQEAALKAEVFSRSAERRAWTGRFAAPMNAVTTEEFGVQRTFNGVRRRIHNGLDYRAAVGTAVGAMNGGTVLLARALFYEGNCVMIDHGYGWLTLYFHLSRLNVAEGQSVKRGQTVGLSGETGRVTGPHLHVSARWQGIYVDPAQLLELPLP